MDAKAVATEFTDLLKAGKHREASDRFWSDDVVSREPMEGPMAVLSGRPAVQGKSDWWYANHEIHSAGCEGPFMHGDQFCVRFTLDVTAKETGQRFQMTEIGLYTLAGGKVVEEKFFFLG